MSTDKPVRTAIILDYASFTQEPEDEAAMILAELQYVGINAELVKWDFAAQVLDECGHLDLVILDYGGVMFSGSPGAGKSQVREIIKYAEDHPGTLVVLWTWYTAAIYLDEWEQEFPDVGDNFVFLTDPTQRLELAADTDVGKKIRAWFGVGNEP